jgi:hypothetical protein
MLYVSRILWYVVMTQLISVSICSPVIFLRHHALAFLIIDCICCLACTSFDVAKRISSSNLSYFHVQEDNAPMVGARNLDSQTCWAVSWGQRSSYAVASWADMMKLFIVSWCKKDVWPCSRSKGRSTGRVVHSCYSWSWRNRALSKAHFPRHCNQSNSLTLC